MSTSGKVTEFFPVLSEYEDLLKDAERRAERDGDVNFVAQMVERYEKYGDETFLSIKQKNWLERIAGVAE